jgi:hypothetical protein
MNWMIRSLGMVGGFTAAVQVSRGLLKAADRLSAGEYRVAACEVANALLAPVKSAYAQCMKIVAEIRQASGDIAESQEPAGGFSQECA